MKETDILLAKVTTNMLLSGYVKKLSGELTPEQRTRLESLKTDVVKLYQTIREMENRINTIETANYDLMISIQALQRENTQLKEENKNLYQGM